MWHENWIRCEPSHHNLRHETVGQIWDTNPGNGQLWDRSKKWTEGPAKDHAASSQMGPHITQPAGAALVHRSSNFDITFRTWEFVVHQFYRNKIQCFLMFSQHVIIKQLPSCGIKKPNSLDVLVTLRSAPTEQIDFARPVWCWMPLLVHGPADVSSLRCLTKTGFWPWVFRVWGATNFDINLIWIFSNLSKSI